MCVFVLAVPCGMRDLSFPTGIESMPHAVEARLCNHWTTREVSNTVFCGLILRLISVMCLVFVLFWGGVALGLIAARAVSLVAVSRGGFSRCDAQVSYCDGLSQ